MKKIFIIIVICLLVSGCQIVDRLTGIAAIEQKNSADKQLAKIKCMELCQNEISNEKDLNQGPCLSNKIIPGWVCDIAHSPRDEMDNEAQNQCSAYRENLAQHFVELDGNCNLIKAD